MSSLNGDLRTVSTTTSELGPERPVTYVRSSTKAKSKLRSMIASDSGGIRTGGLYARIMGQWRPLSNNPLFKLKNMKFF